MLKDKKIQIIPSTKIQKLSGIQIRDESILEETSLIITELDETLIH